MCVCVCVCEYNVGISIFIFVFLYFIDKPNKYHFLSYIFSCPIFSLISLKTMFELNTIYFQRYQRSSNYHRVIVAILICFTVNYITTFLSSEDETSKYTVHPLLWNLRNMKIHSPPIFHSKFLSPLLGKRKKKRKKCNAK